MAHILCAGCVVGSASADPLSAAMAQVMESLQAVAPQLVQGVCFGFSYHRRAALGNRGKSI
jgi:hypothetical protein